MKPTELQIHRSDRSQRTRLDAEAVGHQARPSTMTPMTKSNDHREHRDGQVCSTPFEPG